MAVVGIVSAISGPNDSTLVVEPPSGAQSWLAVIWDPNSPFIPAPQGWSPLGMWGTENDIVMVYQSNTTPTSLWTRGWADGFPFKVIIIGYDHPGATYGLADNPGSSVSLGGPANLGSDVVRIWRGAVAGEGMVTPPAGTNNFEAAMLYYPQYDFTAGVAVAHSIHQGPGEIQPVGWSGSFVMTSAAATAMIPPYVEPSDAPTGLAATGGFNEVGVSFDSMPDAESYIVQWRRTDLTPPAPQTQANLPWHLPRGTQEYLPHPVDYTYTWDGSGTTVYVMDSGIRVTHQEFANINVDGASIAAPWYEEPGLHGTGVASMAVGATVGVAKGADVYMLQVYDANGYDSNPTLANFEAARDAIIAHANGKPAPVVMSFSPPDGGSTVYQPFYEAGLLPFIAAGNVNEEVVLPPDYEHPYPDRGILEDTIVVGSATADSKANFSNYGEWVHLYAAIEPTISAGNENDDTYWPGGATSHAAPTAAGVDAKILQGNPELSVARRREVIISQSFKDQITVPPGSHSRILNLNASTEFWSDHPATANSLTLDGLDRDASYEVRVAAVSGGTQSDWSDPVAVNTGGQPSSGVNAYVGDRPIEGFYLGNVPITGMLA